MKRILHVISQIPGRTGSGIFLQSLLREAGKKNCPQAVVAGIPKYQESYGFGDMDNVDFYPVVFDTEELPFPVVGMSDVMPYTSTRYRDLTEDMYNRWRLSFSTAIINAVEAFKPDVIISHHLWVLTALVRNLISNIPVVSICHGTDIRQLNQARKFAEYVIEGCRNVEITFALSEFQKEKIIDYYGIDAKDIIVIGGGFDSDIFYPNKLNKNKDVIKLVYAGKLSNSKGVSSLLRACSQLDFEDDKVELIIAGSGSGKEEEDIKRLADNCRIKVNFLGMIPQKKLAEIFRESDIFILPSFYEGLSLVLIEALASGLRVVSTDLPGLRKWLGNDIAGSEIIEFVKLPKLIDTDIPIQEELPQFETSLKKGIEKQISRVINEEGVNNEKVYTAIKQMSWHGIFNKIEGSIEKLYKDKL